MDQWLAGEYTIYCLEWWQLTYSMSLEQVHHLLHHPCTLSPSETNV